MLIKGSWPSAAPLLRVSLGWIRGLSVRGPWFYSCPGQSLLMPTGQEVPAVLPVGHPCMLPGGLLFIQEVCKDTRQCWGQGCELRSPLWGALDTQLSSPSTFCVSWRQVNPLQGSIELPCLGFLFIPCSLMLVWF